MNTLKCKHVVAMAIAVIFCLPATAQHDACDGSFSPVITASFGMNASGNFGSAVELGIWGRNVPVSFYAGFAVWENRRNAEEAKSTGKKVPETLAAPYLKLGIVVFRNTERSFFNEVTVTASQYPEVGYRLYKRYGNKLMLGLEPKLLIHSKTSPAVSANFTFTL